MKRVRAVILSLLLLVAASAYALSSFIEISAGGGWSSLGYKMSNNTVPTLSAQVSGSYGYNAHLGYGLMFNPYVGIGIGVDFSRYGASASVSGKVVSPGMTDSDGELYDHILTVHRWQETQSISYVEIPLSLYLRYPVSEKVAVYAQLGAKACIPVLSRAQYAGDITHAGFYEPWMLTLTDMPNHGFYSASYEDRYAIRPRFGAAGFVKLGIEGPVDTERRVWLFGALHGTMHFLPAFDIATTDSPLFSSSLAEGKPLPMAIGAEIGVRFRIPHPKKHNCRCYRW